MISSLRMVLVAAALLLAGTAFAQDITVKGVVKDATGLPLPGAAVFVPGTTIGTITDEAGQFTLSAKAGTELTVSFIGYEDKKFNANKNFQEIVLDDSLTLQEVVVTALGVAREKKTVGYAIQDVKGDAIVDAHETNIANALTGKIAGVQVLRSSGGPGASSKIVLRGNNSLTGLNQPLVVVDGVPMDNFTGSSGMDFWNGNTDYGNGLSDINPEDVESMTVLKGASAAALYGSRAGNGVILITTKKGREQQGLGITVTGTVAATSFFTRPEMTTKYGQGSLGIYDETSYLNWGPAIGTNGLQAYDNVTNFFEAGLTDTENITLSQQYGKTGIYASWTRMNDDSQVPGATLKRNNFMLRGTTTFGKGDNGTSTARSSTSRPRLTTVLSPDRTSTPTI